MPLIKVTMIVHVKDEDVIKTSAVGAVKRMMKEEGLDPDQVDADSFEHLQDAVEAVVMGSTGKADPMTVITADATDLDEEEMKEFGHLLGAEEEELEGVELPDDHPLVVAFRAAHPGDSFKKVVLSPLAAAQFAEMDADMRLREGHGLYDGPEPFAFDGPGQKLSPEEEAELEEHLREAMEQMAKPLDDGGTRRKEDIEAIKRVVRRELGDDPTTH